jgi:hypothetical protein
MGTDDRGVARRQGIVEAFFDDSVTRREIQVSCMTYPSSVEEKLNRE